jgi:hypothetical protein
MKTYLPILLIALTTSQLITEEQKIDLTLGFLEGLKVVTYPKLENCSIAKLDILNLIGATSFMLDEDQNIMHQEHTLQMIHMLYTGLIDITNKYQDSCMMWMVGFNEMNSDLFAYLRDRDYNDKVYARLAEKKVEIENSYNFAHQMLNERKFSEAAKAFGELMNFIYFWDYL